MSPEELYELWSDRSNWHVAGIYHCPADPRLIVSKRIKWTGYTMNFAHKRSYLLLLGILLLLLIPISFLTFLETTTAIVSIVGVFIVSVIALVLLCHWESTRAR